LDADRALILAGAAGGALPEHRLAVDLTELACFPSTLGGSRLAAVAEQRLLRLEDDLLRVELLAGTPRRAVHLAAAALDACERVEHHLAAEILDRFEPDLFLLEIEVGQVAELRRLEEHRDRRQHEVEMLRGRNQRQEGEDDQHMYPPVHAAGRG